MNDLATEVRSLSAAHRHRDTLAALDRAGASAETPAGRLARVSALGALERFTAANELAQHVRRDPASTPAERVRAKILSAQLLLRNSPFVDEALELAIEAAGEAQQLGATNGAAAEAKELAATARLEAVQGFARKRCRELAAKEMLSARHILGDDARVLAVAGRLLVAFDERALARERFTAAVAAGGAGQRSGLMGLALVDALAGDFERAHAHLDAIEPKGPDDRETRRLRLRLLSAQGRWADVITLLDELLLMSPEADTAVADRHARAAALYQLDKRAEAQQAWHEVATRHADAPLGKHARRHAESLARQAQAQAQSRVAARRRLAAFPSVAQLRDHCGPAAVELYLRFFGMSAEQVAVARSVKLAAGGTPVLRLRRFLDDAGFTTRRVEADLDRMRRLLDAGIPVIMEEDYSESRHVAVAIGYDDALGVLAVQDPMSHEVRETTYEQLAALRGFSNNGALVAVPKAEAARLDAAGAPECPYIALVDDAWAALEAGKGDDVDRLIDQAVALRADYELAWLCRFQRAWQAAQAAGQGDTPARAKLRAVVADIVKLWPDDEWPQQLLGEVLVLDQRLPEALQAFDRARQRDPADARNWARLADCHLAAGREDDAHAALTQTLRLNPAHARANESQAWQYWRLGRTTAAAITNAVARELSPKNPHNHGLHAAILAGRGELGQALAAWGDAQELAPGHLPFVVERARILARLGRLDEAVHLLSAETKARPTETPVRVELADLLLQHGRPDAARAVAAEVLALDAAHPGALAITGGALAAMGKFEEGAVELHKALQLRPMFTWALVEIGKCLGRTGHHGKAVQACAAAFGLSGLPAHELALAIELATAGQGKDAARRARALLSGGRLVSSDWSRAVDLLGAVEGLGPTHQFLTELGKQAPRHVDLLRTHAWFVLERFWAPGLAREVITRLVAVLPDDVLALAAQGAAAMDGAPAGHAQGEQQLRTAIARAPSLATPRRFLAPRLGARGRYAEALDVLAACPGAFVDAELRVMALLGLDRVGDAEAIAASFAANNAPGTEPPVHTNMLRFRIAYHRREWAAALALAEQVSRQSREQEDDGRLDSWEEAKFDCLLRLGELDRARRFGEQQGHDAGSAARLARVAANLQVLDLAAHFCAYALRVNPNEPLARAIHQKLAAASNPATGAATANAAGGAAAS
jgi:tetratricopeptide (TPR) repeat protein